MWASRKPGGGGGSGTPGDSHLAGLHGPGPTRVCGAHFAGPVPGVDPHCPGAGRLSFVRGLNVVLPPLRVGTINALPSRAAALQLAAKSAAVAASVSTGGIAVFVQRVRRVVV